MLVDGCSSTPASRWDVFALEINLRKGGTTHPFAALRNLAPGHYDIDSGQWVTLDGSPRYYESTDNLLDPSWQGRPPSEVIRAVSDAGFQFDPTSKAGVVLHMLSCLAIDGRFGLTAVWQVSGSGGGAVRGNPGRHLPVAPRDQPPAGGRRAITGLCRVLDR